MIRMMAEGTLWGPCVFCDNCNQRIIEADSATVVWPIDHGGAKMKVGYPQYVHKASCHNALEERLRAQGYGIGSDDLPAHLRKLQFDLHAEKRPTSKPKDMRQATPQA